MGETLVLDEFDLFIARSPVQWRIEVDAVKRRAMTAFQERRQIRCGIDNAVAAFLHGFPSLLLGG